MQQMPRRRLDGVSNEVTVPGTKCQGVWVCWCLPPSCPQSSRRRVTHVRHLEDKLWELRVRAERGFARGIYVTATGRQLELLRVFAKKSGKTPRRALKTAKEGMRQVTR